MDIFRIDLKKYLSKGYDFEYPSDLPKKNVIQLLNEFSKYKPIKVYCDYLLNLFYLKDKYEQINYLENNKCICRDLSTQNVENPTVDFDFILTDMMGSKAYTRTNV